MSGGGGGTKRTYSFSSSGPNRPNVNNAGNSAPNKKKKKYSRAATFVPPTKFLLGGNIRDPLNLNGLQQGDDDETAPATVEVKVFKDVALPTLADFLLGGNINDPLNLRGIAAEEQEGGGEAGGAVDGDAGAAAESTQLEQAASAATADLDDKDAGGADVPDAAAAAAGVAGAALAAAEPVPCAVGGRVASTAPGSQQPSGVRHNGAKLANLHLNVAMRKLDRKDRIVSPVIPQPYRPLKAIPFRQIITPDLGSKASKTPKFREKSARFQYGNYPRYYGRRNAYTAGADLRVEMLQKHRDFFANKDVLDVGCNTGHVSFVIAHNFGARTVTGMDIDRHLVEVAKKKAQYYVNCPSPYSWESPSPAVDSGGGGGTGGVAATATSDTSASAVGAGADVPLATATTAAKKVDLKYKCYPVSMPILYGPIYDCRDFETDKHRLAFPKNVRFVHGNYVPESEAQLAAEQPLYDTIVCLSVTKWMHLNWGDGGLKLAFKRMFAQLKPGGILMLEPQSWDSYKRRKSLTETIWRNYRDIQLFPHHFDRYLLSSEVGFSRCQTLGVVHHQQKGFRRAIKVFKKAMPSVHSLVSPSAEC